MNERLPATGLSRPEHQLNPLVELHWRQFGDDWILFEALSGQTHQMAAATAAMLMCYEVGPPLSIAALLAALDTDFGIPVDATRAAPVSAVVDQLAALGLIIPMAAHVVV